MGLPALYFMLGVFWEVEHLAESKKGGTVQAAERLAQPVLEELGLRLWEVVFEKEGSGWYLRYLLDKDGGVDITDCENFSRRMDTILDEADPISQSYTLEVSSPGIERSLTRDWHFDACMGQMVSVRFIRPVDGVRDFTGVLTGYEDGTVTMLLEDDLEMTFRRAEASFIRLYYDFSQEYNSDEGDNGQ